MAKDSGGNLRLRFEFAPHEQSSICSPIASVSAKKELHIAKKVHRPGHGTADEMKELKAGENMDDEKVAEAYREVCDACELCAATGRPVDYTRHSMRSYRPTSRM